MFPLQVAEALRSRNEQLEATLVKVSSERDELAQQLAHARTSDRTAESMRWQLLCATRTTVRLKHPAVRSLHNKHASRALHKAASLCQQPLRSGPIAANTDSRVLAAGGGGTALMRRAAAGCAVKLSLERDALAQQLAQARPSGPRPSTMQENVQQPQAAAATSTVVASGVIQQATAQAQSCVLSGWRAIKRLIG